MKIGLIQTRGLGDIVIALPIARYFYENNNEVFWPIDENYLASFQEIAPWVNWIGVSRDATDFFHQTPLDLLSEMNVERTIVLYSYLSNNLKLPNKLLQHALKFDEYKYAVSNVPFS